jgi:very-short-patch-repair endonuclease
MAALDPPDRAKEAWNLAARQRGVIALWQLLEIGYTKAAIRHRIAKGRLHPIHRGVYAVGRPELTREGEWMAAVLSCGSEALLSHGTAAALWGIREEREHTIHVTVPRDTYRGQRPGITPHRRSTLTPGDICRHLHIPVTAPVRTLLDIAPALPPNELEAAINEADKRDRCDPDCLREALDEHPGIPGVAKLRRLLDRGSFRLTDSDLERRFLRIARRAGIPMPETQQQVNGYRVDFYWPELGLIVETDGLRYHRTSAQQTNDRIRDQRHTSAGLTVLRFTHAQVRYEPVHVQTTLETVARRTT